MQIAKHQAVASRNNGLAFLSIRIVSNTESGCKVAGSLCMVWNDLRNGPTSNLPSCLDRFGLLQPGGRAPLPSLCGEVGSSSRNEYRDSKLSLEVAASHPGQKNQTHTCVPLYIPDPRPCQAWLGLFAKQVTRLEVGHVRI